MTTFTDVIAFFVGTNTLLPGLQSFCVYAAVSIFTIYALQVTHFVAWFSLGKSERERERERSFIGNFKTVFQYFIPSGLLVGWMDIELHRLFLSDLEINLFRSKKTNVCSGRLHLLFCPQELQAGSEQQTCRAEQTVWQGGTPPHQHLCPALRPPGHAGFSRHRNLGDDVSDSGLYQRFPHQNKTIGIYISRSTSQNGFSQPIQKLPNGLK